MLPKTDVIITGFFHRHNFGDDLFEWVYRKFFETDPRLKRFKPHYVATDDIHHLNIVELKTSCACIVLAGGDVLNDYFLRKIKWLLQQFGSSVPVVAMSVGVPYIDIISEAKLDFLSAIVGRAKGDVRLLRSRYDNQCVWYQPDVACLLPMYVHQRPNGTMLLPKSQDTSLAIGVCLARPIVKSNVEYEQVVKQMADFFDMIAAYKTPTEQHFELYLLPFNTHKESLTECDYYINRDIMDAVTEKMRIHNVEKRFSVEEMYAVFQSELDYVLPMRYHAHIMSIVTNTPMLSLGISSKVKNLLSDVGLSDTHVDAMTVNEKDLPITFDTEKAFTVFKDFVTCSHTSQHELFKTYLASTVNGNDVVFPNLLYNYVSSPPEKTLDQRVRAQDRGDVIRKTAGKVLEYLSGQSPSEEDINRLLKVPGRLKELVESDDSDKKKSCDFLAGVICYELLELPFSKYHYGMSQKLLRQDFTMEKDLRWVWSDSKKTQMNQGTDLFNVKVALFNARYVSTDDFRGYHRSGWQYVVDNLMQFHGTNVHLVFDNYVDRTFHWAEDIYKYAELIPYDRPWCGFLHHTFDTSYSPFNVPALFKKDTFLKSLDHCVALFTLSKDLKTKLDVLLQHHGFGHITTRAFVHPTEIPATGFDFYRFADNPSRKVIQIGAWLRDPFGIYELEPYESASQSNSRARIDIQKAALQGRSMDNYFKPNDLSLHVVHPDHCTITLSTFESNELTQIQPDTNKFIAGLVKHILSKHRSVQMIPTVDNDEYDQLLSENIVFLKLVDASAVNTVIECIVRATPILVNRHPALEEVLSKEYPFFYDTLQEAGNMCNDVELIRRTHRFLQGLNKRCFTMEFFLDQVEAEMKKILHKTH